MPPKELKPSSPTSIDNAPDAQSSIYSVPYVPTRLVMPSRQPASMSMTADVGDSLRSEAIRSINRVDVSSSLPVLTFSSSPDDKGTDIENDMAPDLPFHNVNTLSNQSISSSSSSDSSEERASVDACLSMDKEKLSPPPVALPQSEGKVEVVRQPLSISSNWRKPLATTTVDSDEIVMEHQSPSPQVVPLELGSTRSHNESVRTFTNTRTASRRGSSASKHHTAKSRVTKKSDDAPPSVNILSSSPYPESEKLSPSERVEHRKEKQRRNHTDSIESFKLKKAVRVSPEEHCQADDIDLRVTWDANIEAVCEALARQRGENENEDGVLAQEMYERELEEAANLAYAEQIDCEERDNERHQSANFLMAQRATEREEAEAAELERRAAEKRHETEKCKEIIVQYLERKVSRTRDKSAEIEQKRVAHSRVSSRAGSVSGDVLVGSPIADPVPIVITPVRPMKNKTKVLVNTPAHAKHCTHTWYDRIVLQRIWQSNMKAMRTSGIPDMKVSWDTQGVAFETGPAPSRGSSAHPRECEEARYCARLIKAAHSKKTANAVDTPRLSGHRKDNVSSDQGTRNNHNPGTTKASKSGRVKGRVTRPAESPVKTEHTTPFYLQAGTAPPPPSPLQEGHDPDESESPESLGSTDGEDSEDKSSDGSYSESSSTEDVDSAWGEDPVELCSEITTCTHLGISTKHTKSGRQYGGRDGGKPPYDDSSESSSEDDEQKPHPKTLSDADAGPPKKGPAKMACKDPSESERDRKRRLRRNSRCKHHSHGSRAPKLGEYCLLEPGDPISAGVPLQQQRKWRSPMETKSSPRPREGMRQMDEDGPTMAVMNRDGVKRKLYQLVRKNDSAGKPAWKSRTSGCDGGGNGTKKPVPAHIKCFNCGENHYKDDCPNKEQMNASTRLKSLKKMPKMASFSDYAPSDTEEHIGGMSERFAHMGKYTDYNVGDSINESVDDAEEKMVGKPSAECGTRDALSQPSNAREEAETLPQASADSATPTRKPAIQIHVEPSIFGVCDDYSDDEFIGEKELDSLAKKMAKHIIWQEDTAEVEEFLFATGELSSLSSQDKHKSKKIGLKCLRTERGIQPATLSPADAGQSRKIAWSKCGNVSVEEVDDEDDNAELFQNMEQPAQFSFPVLLEEVGEITTQHAARSKRGTEFDDRRNPPIDIGRCAGKIHRTG
ncbi:hypothetical protein C8R44DRAFT_729686 [Mycena epipterygia]|nr:hypothetical protein C8R44DRAFT_729686 [Mycena epipterygia]